METVHARQPQPNANRNQHDSCSRSLQLIETLECSMALQHLHRKQCIVSMLHAHVAACMPLPCNVGCQPRPHHGCACLTSCGQQVHEASKHTPRGSGFSTSTEGELIHTMHIALYCMRMLQHSVVMLQHNCGSKCEPA